MSDQAVPRPPPAPPPPRPVNCRRPTWRRASASAPAISTISSATSGRSPRPCCSSWPSCTTSTCAPSPPAAARAPGPTRWPKSSPTRMLSDLGVPRYELAELANNAPGVADAIARLYTARARKPSATPASRRRRRRAGAGHARDLGARLHPAAPQPLSRAGGSRRDAGRGAQRSAVDGRADAPPAEGRVGDQRLGRAAGRARQRQPALRPRPPPVPACRRSCAPRTAPSRSPISWRWSSSRQ